MSENGIRRVEVDPARMLRWVDGFAERHGGLAEGSSVRLVMEAASAGEAFRLVGSDGELAECSPGLGGSPVALLLVRRGGYAVGLAPAGAAGVVQSKTGTRYVQSRTAAGGWSQQRYARRRGNQADALVLAVAEHADRVIGGALEPGERLAGLVLGGDRALYGEAREASRVLASTGAHAGVPVCELPDLPDPKRATLDLALKRARAWRVTLTPA